MIDAIRDKPVYYDEELTERIIGCAIEVHRYLGPGLLESAYEECLCHELNLQGMAFERRRPLPLEYKGIKLDCGYRMDTRALPDDFISLEKNKKEGFPSNFSAIYSYNMESLSQCNSLFGSKTGYSGWGVNEK